jgi:hypothetical protein
MPEGKQEEEEEPVPVLVRDENMLRSSSHLGLPIHAHPRQDNGLECMATAERDTRELEAGAAAASLGASAHSDFGNIDRKLLDSASAASARSSAPRHAPPLLPSLLPPLLPPLLTF